MFHDGEVSLLTRLKVERDRVKAIPEKPKTKTATKITYWNKYGVKRDTCFSGKPDMDRVVREFMDEDGCLAVMIKCTEELAGMAGAFLTKHFSVFIPDLLPLYSWEYKGYKAWFGLEETDLQTAVDEYLAKQPKVESPHKFVEAAGKYTPCEKMPAEYHVGELVYVPDLDKCLVIKEIKEDRLVFGNGNWIFRVHGRPATLDEIAEFYTRKVGGVLVRACYLFNNGVQIKTSDNIARNFYYDIHKLIISFITNSNVPIMPWSEVERLYDGEMPAPEKGE